MKKTFTVLAALFCMTANAQNVDYSVVSVPEESSFEFVCITSDNDNVAMPQVKRTFSSLTWNTNPVIAVSPDGQNIAYLSYRNGTCNIFIKDATRKSASVQRTKRSMINSFAYSSDGKNICFSEIIDRKEQVYQTSASQGFVCRQITDSNKDTNPVYSPDNSQIYFARTNSVPAAIWSYNLQNNFLSSYTIGSNPFPVSAEELFCTRTDSRGKSDIWRINLGQGVEECVVTSLDQSFASPSVSPDGKWILFVGSSGINTGTSIYYNTDIYVVHPDGSELTQLTYHAANDLSPVWSKDGKYIYFVSQRGNSSGTANIWRMTFMQ